MNIVTYLSSLLTHGMAHSTALHSLHIGQEHIMATLTDVQTRLDTITASVAEIPGTLTSISDGIANVAADIEVLKAQIGTAPIGITPEEADGVVGTLDTIQTNLALAVAGLQSAASSLQAVAAAQ